LITQGLNELPIHSHSTWPQYVVVHRALKQSYNFGAVPGLLLFYGGTKSWISPLWFRALHIKL